METKDNKVENSNDFYTLLCKGSCVILNKMTDEMFICKNSDDALKKAIAENLKDEEHPSFYLYDINVKNKCKLIAKLHRDFGDDNLYWRTFA